MKLDLVIIIVILMAYW